MTTEHMSVPCIICDKPLANVFCLDEVNQPDDAVSCEVFGQYGSAAFDPMDGSYLEFNVCDECLVRKANNGVILIGRVTYNEFGGIASREPLKYWQGPSQYRYHINKENDNSV